MVCKNCGAELAQDAKFCTVCGAQVETTVPPQQQYTTSGEYSAQPQAGQPVYTQPVMQQPVYVAQNQPGHGFAVASLVLGIVSFFCCGFITGILAIIFGAVAKNKGNRSGMATAGIVCGIVGIVLLIFVYIFAGEAYTDLYNEFTPYYY